MKRTHQLIKFKTEAADELKRLRNQMGTANLDDLIMRLIKFRDTHLAGPKDPGWSPIQQSDRMKDISACNNEKRAQLILRSP